MDNKKAAISEPVRVLVNQTIRKVSEDYENMKYNTAIAQMMTLVNAYSARDTITAGEYKTLLLLLSPVSPHICEEIWQRQGYGGTVRDQAWPSYDEKYLLDNEVEIAVQINGKIKSRMMVAATMSREEGARDLPDSPEVKDLIGDREIKKCVFVPGRLLSLVLDG